MSLFSSFRKPAWQSGNPTRRLAAVSGSDDPQLRAALPTLAVEDTDASIRREALRRCDDPALYVRAMTHDVDPGLRAWARERWLAALTDNRIEADDSALARLSPDELETLAVKLDAAPVRQRILQRITRPGFLAERTLADPDANIRLALLERIEGVPALERVAEKARRFDKRLARAARERADALRLATGDADVQERRAQTLCTALEQVMREPLDLEQRRDRLSAIESDWRALDAGALSPDLHARFAGAREVILAQLQPPALPTEPEPVIAQTVVSDDVVAEPSPPSLEEIAAQTRLAAELAALAEQKAREKEEAEAQRQRQTEQRAAQRVLLQQLSTALEAGDMSAAGKALSSLDPSLLAESDQRQWQTLQPQLRELRAWQRWAGQGARERLCEEVEALEGRGLHPDALASRIRELQQQWRQIHTGAAPDGLDRRFHAACTRILKPARGFFDKRDALREEHRKLVDRLLSDIDTALGAGEADDAGEAMAIPAPATDLTTEKLLDLQQQATSHLRQLDRLAPGDRRTVADRLRQVLDRIRPLLETRFDDIERARERLIEDAEKLVGEADGKKLGNEARTLTQRWQALGKGRRGRDQQQWRRFRAALDQAFAQLDIARRETAAAIEARRQQAHALIEAVAQAADLEGDALLASVGQVRDLREQWQALNLRDADLGNRLDEALSRHRLALDSFKAQRQREQWLALVHGAPTVSESTSDAREQALSLLFEAEALAGIEPPDDEREARRAWQLQRLQAHLGGGAPASDLESLLQRWRALDGLDAGDRQRFGERLARVIDRSR